MHFDALTRRRKIILHHYFQEELDKAVDSSRKANSVRNDNTSNNMAEAAGPIELFLNTVQSGDPKYSVLHGTPVCPQRGMRACRHRRTYVPMAANEYEQALEPGRLTKFVGELVARAGIQAQVADCVLLLATTLCSLVNDNAISNAFRRGTNPESAFHLAVASIPTGDGRLRLCYALTDQVGPSKPVLTKDFVARSWQGTPAPASVRPTRAPKRRTASGFTRRSCPPICKRWRSILCPGHCEASRLRQLKPICIQCDCPSEAHWREWQPEAAAGYGIYNPGGPSDPPRVDNGKRERGLQRDRTGRPLVMYT